MQANTAGKPTQIFQFTDRYIDAIRRRDPGTIEHFFRYFKNVIGFTFRRRVPSHALIEDIQQETFARVLRCIKLSQVARPERFGAFVLAVSRNVYREYGRNVPLSNMDEAPESADTSPGPEAWAQAAELQHKLRTALAAMPERDRALLSMAIIEERSFHEISRVLRVKRSSLPVMLHRAKSRLRQRMETELNSAMNHAHQMAA